MTWLIGLTVHNTDETSDHDDVIMLRTTMVPAHRRRRRHWPRWID